MWRERAPVRRQISGSHALRPFCRSLDSAISAHARASIRDFVQSTLVEEHGVSRSVRLAKITAFRARARGRIHFSKSKSSTRHGRVWRARTCTLADAQIKLSQCRGKSLRVAMAGADDDDDEKFALTESEISESQGAISSAKASEEASMCWTSSPRQSQKGWHSERCKKKGGQCVLHQIFTCMPVNGSFFLEELDTQK